MPARIFMVLDGVAAIGAAVAMHWALRLHQRWKRQGRVWESAAVGMPVFLGLAMAAAAVGAVEWGFDHQLADEGVGIVLAGILVGAVTARPEGFSLGGDDEG